MATLSTADYVLDMGEHMRYDVLGVNLKTRIVRVMGKDLNESDADAFERMAVLRRGVEEEFFVTVPHDFYANGDRWEPPIESASA